MAQPTNSAVHVDAALTNISVAFLQNAQNFVAGRVFPNVPVMKQSDRYFVFNRGDFNRDEAQIRAPSTKAPGSGYDIDNTPSYFANVRAFRQPIDDQIRANADVAVNVDRSAADFVMQKLMISKEVNWVTNYFTGSLWTNDYDGVASSAGASETIQWSDGTSGDPIGDIRAARTSVLESTGFEPNTLTIGQQVYDALVDHPDIVDRVKYSGGVGNQNPAKVNAASIASLMDLERVLVAKAIKNTAEKEATDSHSFIAGKKALLSYSPPTPGLMTPSAGYTFSWQGYLGQTNPFGIAVKNYRVEELGSQMIEGEMAFDHKLVSADLGFFWDTIVA